MNSGGQNLAKLALSCFCNVLNLKGITCLDPESVRQAKFNGHVASKIWLALHHLVILKLCKVRKFTKDNQLQAIWKNIAEESCLDELPPEGALCICHYLREWGCPLELVSQLDVQSPGSRAPLLALGWLAKHCNIFEHALEDSLQTSDAALQPLLPPLPLDTCSCPNTLSAYIAGVTEASTRMADTLANLAQESEAGADVALESAARVTLSLVGKVRAELMTLTHATEARVKLQKRLADMQVAEGTHPSKVLTPLELHLLANPALLQSTITGISAAATNLSAAVSLAAHARLFWQWMSSVLAEQVREDGGGPQANHPALQVLATELDSLLPQLPQDDPDKSRLLLEHLDKKLAATMSAAAPHMKDLAAKEKVSMYTAARGAAQPASSNMPALTVEHFRRVVQQAVSKQRCQQEPSRARVSVVDWSLPADMEVLVQQAAQQTSRLEEAQSKRYWALQHYRSAVGVRYEDVPEQEGSTRKPPRAGVLDRVPSMENCVDLEDETKRLLDLTLSAARPLARTRAAAKQELARDFEEVIQQGLRVTGL